MNEKVAIVTGGTGALGRVIVRTLSDEGFKVYVPTQTMDRFTAVFDNSDKDSADIKVRKIFAFDCDATDESSVCGFVEKVKALEKGRIGYLVNTVGGIDSASDVDGLSAEALSSMLKLNFYSAFFFTRETVKVMKSNNFGRIVSVGALAALQASPGRFAYSVSKQAVINLMNTVSSEMKEYDIRCNTIVPGILDTPANREWGSEEDFRTWVTPEQVSAVIKLLFSESGGAVRDSVIKVLGRF